MKYKILTILSVFIAFFIVIKTAAAADVARIIFNQQGKMVVGRQLKVEVFIDSTAYVNAAQINITYPSDQFTLKSIESSNSKFSIKAEEKFTNGKVTIARGNITPLKGRNLLAILVVIPQKSTASISNITYSVADSLVMSRDNVNILAGSQVMTLKAISPTPELNASVQSEGLISIFKKSVKEFFGKLFGR